MIQNVRNMLLQVVVLLPGLLLVSALALGAHYLHGMTPPRLGAAFGEVVFGLASGLIICNLVKLPARLLPGIQFAFSNFLRAAIILLGCRISLYELARLHELVLILILITLALSVAISLGQLLGLSRKLSVLIGLGTAICGNTAISVAAPVIQARDEEVSFAIASNTLFGTVAVFVLPLLGHFLGLSDAFYGTWAGVAVNDTSQVAAAGFSFSEAAGDLATSIKLIRNALMGFVVIGVGLAFSKGQPNWKQISLWDKVRQSVPLFVLGFLAMATLNTFGFFENISQFLHRPITADLTLAAKILILLALVALGLSTHLGDMRKMGLRPLFVGLAASLTTTVTGFIFLRYIFKL